MMEMQSAPPDHPRWARLILPQRGRARRLSRCELRLHDIVLTPCARFRPVWPVARPVFFSPKFLLPARPRAARRPGVVHTDPMGHFNEKSRPGSVFPDNSLNWVRSRRSLLKHAHGVGHALVLSHGAAPRPTRPGMIHSMSIAKPPVRIRHGNGRVWKNWWPMWPLSPTGLWWPNMLYWASVSILGRRNSGIFFSCFTST